MTVVPVYHLHFSRNNGNITGLQNLQNNVPLLCYQLLCSKQTECVNVQIITTFTAKITNTKTVDA